MFSYARGMCNDGIAEKHKGISTEIKPRSNIYGTNLSAFSLLAFSWIDITVCDFFPLYILFSLLPQLVSSSSSLHFPSYNDVWQIEANLGAIKFQTFFVSLLPNVLGESGRAKWGIRPSALCYEQLEVMGALNEQFLTGYVWFPAPTSLLYLFFLHFCIKQVSKFR